MTRDIVLYLHMHQPLRVRPYSIFDVGIRHDYFDSSEADTNNQLIFRKVATKSYHPMLDLLIRLAKDIDSFSLNLSISGLFLEQCETWDPVLLEKLQVLVASNKVELVSETYYHSLAFFYSKSEFEKQVEMHTSALERLFNVKPVVFRNTELAYNNDLASWVEDAGYKAVITEGWDPILEWRSPHYLYSPSQSSSVALFLKDYRLSDDLAFRFSDKSWAEYPLTANKYKKWIDDLPEEEKLINLFMDFETFGEHQWRETGIFKFFERFVKDWVKSGNRFATFSEAMSIHDVVDNLDIPDTITWADSERDLTAWLGNAMQHEVAEALYRLEKTITLTDDKNLIHHWRLLQASDHLYYLSTKWFNDGNVHAYFSPYVSPYEAFMSYMNSIRDIRYRISDHSQRRSITGG